MDESSALSIGQVANLTGLTPHAIRKWEQRYSAVTPQRSPGGDRRYQPSDVQRLARLKLLVDDGHSIGKLVQMSEEQLATFTVTNGQPPAANLPLRVLALGELTAKPLREIPGVQLVSPEQVDKSELDVLVIERSSLDETFLDDLSQMRRQYQASNVIVVYGFSTTTIATRLSDDNTACLRTPVNPRELQRIVLAMCTRQLQQLNVPRRYSNDVLAKVASHPLTIGCECPRHLADLIVALADFEEYSAQCLAQSPADAHVHQVLRQTAQQGREAFESALDLVARHEQIPIDQWQQSARASDQGQKQ